jgi:AcrR family transcriptional regulator
MGNPRANNKRTVIVTAALRLFAGKGIKGTTIRDIAAAAGVTEGALYRHFEGKEQLAQSLFGECALILHERLQQSVEGVQGAHSRLCALARGVFTFAEQDPEAYEFVMARHHDNIGGLAPDQPRPKDLFVEVIEEGMASGELRRMDPHLGAAIVIGMCLRTIFFLDRGMIDTGRDQVAGEICHAVRAVFEPDAAAGTSD